jgi:hypothetical protein
MLRFSMLRFSARGARKKFVFNLFVLVSLCWLDREIEIVALRTVRLSYGAVCVGVGVSLVVVAAVVVAGFDLT